ncbi:MAG: hypothetical protein HUU08_09310 [Candidatus Brocadia sp.]|nr:hypothetical protein [Candidatus Brocadia sp.]
MSNALVDRIGTSLCAAGQVMRMQPQHNLYRFSIGASRFASGSFHTEESLIIPDTKAFIKSEKRTLVWRKTVGNSEATVVKMYRHRGFVDWHRERLFNFKVQREYEALHVLESAGVPCSVPLLWGFGSASEHGRFEILVTREIPAAVNLKEAFRANTASVVPDDLPALFDVVRQMHQCGIYHGALLPKNILVTSVSQRRPTFCLVDLIRALHFPADIQRTVMARYDLLSLMHGLTNLHPGINCETLLSHYGLGRTDTRELLDRLVWYRSTRHLRNRLAFQFKIRALGARCCSRLSLRSRGKIV